MMHYVPSSVRILEGFTKESVFRVFSICKRTLLLGFIYYLVNMYLKCSFFIVDIFSVNKLLCLYYKMAPNRAKAHKLRQT